MDKKNVLIIIPSLKLGGGAERVASIIGSNLYNKGYKLTFLTFYDAKQKYDFKGEEFCLNERISNFFLINIYKLFKRAYNIKRYCKKRSIETSISFMEEANFPNIISKILFKNMSKIIVSIRQSVNFMPKTYQVLIKLLYPKADLVLPNSQEEKENIIKLYNLPENKVDYIYNPLDIPLIHIKAKESLDKTSSLFTNDIFTFVTVGRLTYQKNQKKMIELFKKFNQQNPKTQLLILGDGELRSEIETNLTNTNIHLLGNKENVYKYLSKADCFLFTSLREGFPNAVLEAMACGLPIISTAFKTGIEELLSGEQYGILIRENIEENFIDAMRKIYFDTSLRKHYQQKSLERMQAFEKDGIIERRESVL